MYWLFVYCWLLVASYFFIVGYVLLVIFLLLCINNNIHYVAVMKHCRYADDGQS